MFFIRRAVTPTLLCMLVLAAVPAAVHFPACWTGGAPLDLDSALFDPPWQDARPEGLTPDDNPFTKYHATRYYPWYRFMHETAARGDSLLWNPLEGLGAPFLAVWRTRVLSPFSLPVYLLPLPLGLLVSVLLKMFVAGLAAYYAGRRFGLSSLMALTVGVAYELSGPILLRGADPMGDVMPWFPLLLVSTERLVLGDLRAWPLGATVVALMALGGDPSALAGAAAFAILYVFVRCLRDWRGFYLHHAVGGTAAIWAAGLLLAAPQILPYLEFRGQGSLHSADVSVAGVHDLIALIAPGLLDPTTAPDAPGLFLLYPGVPMLLLLALWWAVRPHLSKRLRRRNESLLGAMVFLSALPFLGAWLAPDFWQAHMPGAGVFFLANAFTLAFLTATAAQQWLILDADQCKAVLPRLCLAIPVYWSALAFLTLWGLFQRGVPVKTMALHLWMPAASGVLVVALLAFTLLRPNARYMALGLCLLAAASQLWTFRAAMVHTPPEQIFPETGFVRSLDALDMRIGGSAGLAEWPLQANGIAQVHNPAGITLNRYEAFIERMANDPLLLRRTGAQGLLLTREDIQGSFAAVRPALRIKHVYPSGAVLFEELGAESRVRVIHAGRTAETLDPSLIASKAPPVVEGVYLPEENAGPEASASLAEPESNIEVRAEIEQGRVGLLVLADAWYPGWVARVDGEERVVHAVDAAFRGVEVNESTREVLFEYKPASFQFGLAACGLAALVLLAGYVRLIFARDRSLRSLN